MEHVSIRARHMVFPTLVQGEGPIVLCLHGFPDLNRTFRHQLPAFAAAGYRAVAPTLPGYHPNCLPPTGRFHLSTLVDDIIGIIDALGAERVHLVGHDWGAALGFGVAARAPERILSLSAAAVPLPLGMPRGLGRAAAQLRCSWYIAFFQLGSVADARVEANDWALIERLWQRWSPSYTCSNTEMRLIKANLALPGVKAVALSYYRDAFDLRSPAGRATTALFRQQIHVPTLALHGDEDGCVDRQFFARSMHSDDVPGGLKVTMLPGTGHFLHLEAPELFSHHVLDWIKQHSP